MVKAALIGYGYWGKILEKYLLQNSDISIVKVCSPELEDNGIYTDSFSEVEDSDEIEAVFIATPVETHYMLCRSFLLRGKHVFCEKPATKTTEELTELVELADRVNRVLYIDYLYLNSPSVNWIRDHFKEAGRVFKIEADIEQFGKFYREDDVYGTIGVHMASAVLYIANATCMENLCFENYAYLDERCIYGECSFWIDSAIPVRVTCNLISKDKIRKIKIYGEKGCFYYDMDGDHTVGKTEYVLDRSGVRLGQRKDMYFDEHNTVDFAIRDFVERMNKRDCGINRKIAVLAQKWLSAARDRSFIK